jgi:hypothetical protein
VDAFVFYRGADFQIKAARMQLANKHLTNKNNPIFLFSKRFVPHFCHTVKFYPFVYVCASRFFADSRESAVKLPAKACARALLLAVMPDTYFFSFMMTFNPIPVRFWSAAR